MQILLVNARLDVVVRQELSIHIGAVEVKVRRGEQSPFGAPGLQLREHLHQTRQAALGNECDAEVERVVLPQIRELTTQHRQKVVTRCLRIRNEMRTTIELNARPGQSANQIEPTQAIFSSCIHVFLDVSHAHTISKYNRSWPGYQSAAYNGRQPAFQMCPSSTHQRSPRHVQLLPHRR